MTMGINCVIRQSSGKLKEEKALYPCVVNAAKIGQDEFERMVCENRGLNPAQVRGVLCGVSETIATLLKLGHSVKVNGLGTFSVDVKGQVVPDNRGVLQLKDASVKRIKITADAALLKQTKDSKFTLLDHTARESATYDTDTAMTAAGALLSDKAFFTCSDFMNETGTSRFLAMRMLRTLEDEGLIHRVRKGRNNMWTE